MKDVVEKAVPLRAPCVHTLSRLPWRNHLMSETMLVRTANGSWEELRPHTEFPDGSMTELFGSDVGPVVAADIPVLVAASRPELPSGNPDAVCVDPSGGVWLVQAALAPGAAALLLPQLIAWGGGLTGMSFEAFERLCDERGSHSLGQWMEAQAADPFDRGEFERTVADNLRDGRFHLAALVPEADPTLVQSLRFLVASGARVTLVEASSFTSGTASGRAAVSAMRTRRVDLGAPRVAAVPASAALAAPTAARPEAAQGGGRTEPARGSGASSPAASKTPAEDAGDADAWAAFRAATCERGSDHVADLIGVLHDRGSGTFAKLSYGEDGELPVMRCVLPGTSDAALVVARADGSIMIDFAALASLDTQWTARAELCQGLERLLGTDLGDVRKVGQMNLTVQEHLMDTTLVEALVDLVADALSSLPGSDRAAA